jgi:hypothetical protein
MNNSTAKVFGLKGTKALKIEAGTTGVLFLSQILLT